MTATANIFEVFSGIQGEGVRVGVRQVFVRFAGCNLECEYCDTADVRDAVPFARVEKTAGGRKFEKTANPVAATALAEFIGRLDPARSHDSVSLTGGEPLLAADFIAELAPLCEGRRFYLETNGTLPRELARIVHLVQMVAMDIKLAAAAGKGTGPEISRAFLSIAARRDAFVKVIVSRKTRQDEIVEAAGVVASVDRDIPLVIQPVTPVRGVCAPPDARRLLELQLSALGVLRDVRVIPQVHKLIGQK